MRVKQNLSIFVSYTHEDETLWKKLEKHLALLKSQDLVTVWHYRNISAGSEWTQIIDKHLEKADIILLLVSASFLASEYCYSIEVKRAMKRHESGEAVVIPIILRPVYWQNALFGKLLALPKDAKPITGRKWHNIDEAFVDVVQGIHKIIEDFYAKSGDASQTGEPSETAAHKNRQLSSHVTLINASLDPHDSPYEQAMEDGRKTIRYKQ